MVDMYKLTSNYQNPTSFSTNKKTFPKILVLVRAVCLHAMQISHCSAVAKLTLAWPGDQVLVGAVHLVTLFFATTTGRNPMNLCRRRSTSSVGSPAHCPTGATPVQPSLRRNLRECINVSTNTRSVSAQPATTVWRRWLHTGEQGASRGWSCD